MSERRGRRAWLGIGLATALAAPAAAAQGELWTIDGDLLDWGTDTHFDPRPGELAGLDDVDGDGVPDVAIGCPYADLVRVRSGADGSHVFDVGGNSNSRFGSMVVPLGDVDGDGRADLGVGAPSWPGWDELGEFRVLSGADGSTLFVDHGAAADDGMGLSATSVGDIDLDGHVDFAYQSSLHLDSLLSELKVASGASGTTLVTMEGSHPGDGFGRALAGGGDIDGDGVPDLVAASIWADPLPSISAFSGASLAAGSPAYLYHVASAEFRWGMTPAMAGDLDGDGLADLAVGLPFGAAEPGVGGRIAFLDASGGVLDIWTGSLYSTNGFGRGLRAVGDMDGDGVGDLCTTTSHASERMLQVLSGADGTRIAVADALQGGTYGNSVGAVVGDLDGDGRNDLLVRERSTTGDVRIQAVSSRQGAAEHLGDGCQPPGAEPLQLHVVGETVPGGEVFVEAFGPEPGPAVLLLGLPAPPTPLPGGCAVHVAPVLATLPLDFHGGGVQLPYALVGFEVPATAAGFVVAIQVFGADGQGQLSASPALLVEVLD